MEQSKPIPVDLKANETAKNPIHIIQGIRFHQYTTEELIDKIRDMPMDENDVIVSGYMKSGKCAEKGGCQNNDIAFNYMSRECLSRI